MLGRASLAALLAGAAAFLAVGCQQPQPIIIEKLPMDPLLSHRPIPTPKAAHAGHHSPTRTTVPAEWIPKGPPRPWRWIVIHHSATEYGSAELFDRWHRARGWDELGYHFVITNGRGGPDGAVQVGSRWAKQKWGAHCKVPGNAYNDYGIGICLVGNFTDKLPTPAQRRSLRKLLTFLMDRYAIGPENVIGHCDAPSTCTECPGRRLHAYLDQVLRPELARHYRLARKR